MVEQWGGGDATSSKKKKKKCSGMKVKFKECLQVISISSSDDEKGLEWCVSYLPEES